MSLINIPYQPLGFTPNKRPTSEDCGCDERTYCAMAQPDDPLCMQFKQTPCEPSIACDGNFLAIESDQESIVDPEFDDAGGNFISNSDFGNTSFWVTQPSWSIAAGVATKVASAGDETMTQTITPTVVNAMYKIIFTISNYVAGAMRVKFVSGSQQQFSSLISGNGTYTVYLKSTRSSDNVGVAYTTFSIIGNAAFAADIDNVTCQRMAITWNFGAYSSLYGSWRLNETSGWAEAFGGAISNGVMAQIGGVVPNSSYNLKVTFEASADGDIQFNVGGSLIAINVFGASTQNILITSGAGTDFSMKGITVNGFVGEISEVKLILLQTDCWTFDADEWTIGISSLCKIPGVADTLTNSIQLDAGELYQIEFTISGRGIGKITAIVDGIPLVEADENKTYKIFTTPTNNSLLSFYADADFDGCISGVYIYLLKQDYKIELRNSDGDFILDLPSSAFNYFEDFVTVCFRFETLRDEFDEKVPYGCYQLYVYDFCAIQFQEIITDGEFVNILGAYWVQFITDINLYISIVAEELTAENVAASTSTIDLKNYWNGSSNDINNPLQVPEGPHNYKIEYDVISNADPANIIMEVLLGMTVGAVSYPATVGHHIVFLNDAAPDPMSDPPPQYFGVRFKFNSSVVGKIVVDNISVKRVEPFEAAFISRCIRYKESFPCTSFITATNTDDAFGFNFFDTGFALQQRLPVKGINPTYPQDSSDYLFSKGSKRKNFSQSEKVWILVIAEVPEWLHDAIRLMRASQTFRIGEPSTNTFTDYFCPQGDYIPEWKKTGQLDLAAVRFEIQLADTDVKFMRNI